MTLSRRASAPAVQHQRLSTTAAFNSPENYEFAPGQRVHTVDGLFGVVQAVYAPRGRGDESYHVVLDNGLGEGEYGCTQITAAHEVEGSVTSLGTAVESYPELGTVLVDNPNPATIEVWASKTASSDPEHEGDRAHATCAVCGEPIHADEDTAADSDTGWVHSEGGSVHGDDGHYAQPGHTGAYVTPEDVNNQIDPALDEPEHTSGLDEHGHLTHDGYSSACGGHDDYSMLPDSSAANSADNKAQHTSLLVLAAADPELRFHLTASWRDVQAKAKRIRSTGGVHIVTASAGLVIGEVQGDHGVYEAGLQRTPGRSMGVHAYSCGCKWAGYHSADPKGSSRFAGRMCSHALALQYEAQSRGMFGRDVYADTEAPKWVPARVKVKYDPTEKDYSYARTGAKVPTGSPLAELAHQAWLNNESAADMVLLCRTAGLTPAVIKTAVDTAWGIDSMVPAGMGATRPPVPGVDVNPASTGPLTAADPTSWQHPEQSYAPKNTFELNAAKQAAYWNPLSTQPNVPQAGPAVPESGGGDKGGEHSAGPLNMLKGKAPGGAGAAGGAGGAAAGEAAGGAAAAEGAAAGGAAAAGGEAAAGLASRLLPLLLLARRRLAELKDEPEGALPFTTGDDQAMDQSDQIEDPSIALAEDYGSTDTDPMNVQASLARVATKNFTDAERAELINEGRHKRASNIDRMDVSGTHYEHQDDDDDEFGFLG